MTNEIRVSQALADQQAMDRPRPTMQTATFSVYAPTELVAAFKASCRIRGEKHPIIVRKLLADYVQQTASDEKQ